MLENVDFAKLEDAHAKTGAMVLAALGVTLNGLSEEESATRRATVGSNTLPSAKPPPLWRRVASQLSSPIVLTLLVAAGISIVMGLRSSVTEGPLARYGDAIAILLIVLLNAVLGIVQESKAEAAVNALGKLSVPRTRVRREGRNTNRSYLATFSTWRLVMPCLPTPALWRPRSFASRKLR